MDILDRIIWNMTDEPYKAIIWDSVKKDYRALTTNEFNTKIGFTFILKCPLNLKMTTMNLDIIHHLTIKDIMAKVHTIYSNIQIVNNMDGMTWFNGFSEIDYPNYVLNVNR